MADVTRRQAVKPVRLPQVRRSKYNARKTTVCGIVFDSAKEARRWQELRALQQAGQINALECQVPYPLIVTNLQTGECVEVGRYVADFRYWTVKTQPAQRDRLVVEDTKGFRTPTYRLKRKIVEALYGIRITET